MFILKKNNCLVIIEIILLLEFLVLSEVIDGKRLKLKYLWSYRKFGLFYL